MKTQITKENAIKIITSAVAHEALITQLEKISNSGIHDWGSGFDVIEPLFNMNFSEMDSRIYKQIWEVFFNTASQTGNDFELKADKIYAKILRISAN